MAHGRTGPDIVMTTRYVGASAIRAVTEHEMDRTPDGSSAIDPLRSHLNEILHGPRNQQEAIDKLWDEGVKKPAQQAETPFVQIVISASPGFFREEGQRPGEWDPDKLQAWKEATLKWLRKEYGRDLAHVSLHLDEDTPHMHILIVPTYDKSPRKPGRIAKGETEADFAARKAAAKNAPAIRTAGRSSNSYWKRNFARRIARQSYHEAVSSLGLGYGKDFIGDDEPSPERKETGAWVREQAAKVREDQAAVSEKAAALEERENLLLSEKAAFSEKKKAHFDAITVEAAAIKKAKADISKELDEREKELDERETRLRWLKDRVMGLVKAFGEAFGLPLPKSMHDAVTALEAEMKQRIDVRDPFRELAAKNAAEDSGPGF